MKHLKINEFPNLSTKGEVRLADKTDRKNLFDFLYEKDSVVYAKAPLINSKG